MHPADTEPTLAILHINLDNQQRPNRDTCTMPRSWPHPVHLAAIALLGASATLLPLFFGLPDVHDGFWHLQWNQAWTDTFLSGDLIPRWYNQAWGGLGNPIFSFYPPLFRLFSLPAALFGASPSLQLKTAIGLIILLHTLLAYTTIEQLNSTLTQRTQTVLLLGALLNPYFLVNLYVRGAWPEALGICFLWGIINAVNLYSAARKGPATIWMGASLTGLLLSHNPTSLIALYSLTILLLLTALRKQWADLLAQVVAIGSSLGLAAFTLLPALMDYGQVTPAFFSSDSAALLFWHGGDAISFVDVLNFIWFSLVLLALAGLSRRTASQRTVPPNLLTLWSGLGLLMSLAMCTAPTGAALLHLPLVSKLQFPWRWLSLAWPCLLIWVGLNWDGSTKLSSSRRALSQVLLTAAIIIWFSGLAKFPKDYINIGPQDLARLDAVLRCSPVATCPQGVEAIRTASNWPLKGAQATVANQVVITMPKEYLPPRLPNSFWVAPRYEGFWFPRQQPAQWASLTGEGGIEILEFRPGHRTVRVQNSEPGTVTLRQFSSPFWQLSVSSWSRSEAGKPITPDHKSPWLKFTLPEGDWRVSLDYSPSLADNLGRTISVLTATGLVSASILTLQRQRRSAG